MVDSILQDEKVCYITGATHDLHRHHIYHGTSNRKVSDDNGFWVWLRWDWHNGAKYGVHSDRLLDLSFKMACQKKFEETHSREEFMELIGKITWRFDYEQGLFGWKNVR
jgi:hypothetical protein